MVTSGTNVNNQCCFDYGNAETNSNDNGNGHITGGDNSHSSVGSFFEGVMTSGYPTDAADNAVQANVVSVGYSSSSGPAYYHIVNRNSGLVMDVTSASISPGASVIQWPTNGGYNQEWSLVQV